MREESKMKAWTTLFLIGMFATTVALAGDVDDVRAAEDNYYAAMNSGDAHGWAQSRLSEESTRFGPGGAFLEVFGSLEEQEQNRKAEFEAGLKYNLRARHLDIRVYGNTAVATLYGVGAAGNNAQVNNRITLVWGKQGGQWKMVHAHLSPLTISTPRIEDRFVGTWSFVSIERRNARGGVVPFTLLIMALSLSTKRTAPSHTTERLTSIPDRFATRFVLTGSQVIA
jgi:ketosteroid isomerase-like protein